jgi:hypothetical protein
MARWLGGPREAGFVNAITRQSNPLDTYLPRRFRAAETTISDKSTKFAKNSNEQSYVSPFLASLCALCAFVAKSFF